MESDYYRVTRKMAPRSLSSAADTGSPPSFVA